MHTDVFAGTASHKNNGFHHAYAIFTIVPDRSGLKYIKVSNRIR